MNNETNNKRNNTDYMGLAALGAVFLLWQLLTIIQGLLIVGGVLALGWGSYWIWSKIQASKNQQRYLDNFYGNMNHNQFNLPNQNQANNQINSHNTSYLPPQQPQVHSTPSDDSNFKDFQEYQQFRNWQRQKNATPPPTQQQSHNPFSDTYEG